MSLIFTVSAPTLICPRIASYLAPTVSTSLPTSNVVASVSKRTPNIPVSFANPRLVSVVTISVWSANSPVPCTKDIFSEVRSLRLNPESPETVKAILSNPGVKSAISTTFVQSSSEPRSNVPSLF